MMDQEPMYSCRHQGCATEVSYPADMLRQHPDGGLVCQDCWQEEDGPPKDADWSGLPKFSSHKEELTEARAEVVDLTRRLDEADERWANAANRAAAAVQAERERCAGIARDEEEPATGGMPPELIKAVLDGDTVMIERAIIAAVVTTKWNIAAAIEKEDG